MSTSIRIPFYKRTSTESEIEAVARCIRSGQLSQGAVVEEFEEDFRKYVGSKFAVAVNSCTSGLFLSLMLTKPKKVSIPSMTFASVASNIIHAGARLVWLDESSAGSRYPLVSDDPKAGTAYDSAHSIHRGDAKGCGKDLICYSFYPTKNLSGIEGGMIATDSKDYAEWLRKARWHGRVGSSWDYVIEFPAWKFNMTNVQAAVGIDYLKRIDSESKAKMELVELYNEMLGTDIKSDHIYQTVVNKRDGFAEFMMLKGIECSMHFKPVHKQPAFRKYYKKLPKTERLSRYNVSLPLFPSLSETGVEEICSLVKKWNEKYPLPEDEYIYFEEFLKQPDCRQAS